MSDTPPDILNIDEAAELLGVSVKTFNKVLHAENIPARKIGREWKFSRAALIAWVGNGRSMEFYDGAGADHAAEQVEHAGANGRETPVSAPETRHGTLTPAERPRARRTAGWHIEMD